VKTITDSPRSTRKASKVNPHAAVRGIANATGCRRSASFTASFRFSASRSAFELGFPEQLRMFAGGEIHGIDEVRQLSEAFLIALRHQLARESERNLAVPPKLATPGGLEQPSRNAPKREVDHDGVRVAEDCIVLVPRRDASYQERSDLARGERLAERHERDLVAGRTIPERGQREVHEIANPGFGGVA
jgi:hypothetical protein